MLPNIRIRFNTYGTLGVWLRENYFLAQSPPTRNCSSFLARLRAYLGPSLVAFFNKEPCTVIHLPLLWKVLVSSQMPLSGPTKRSIEKELQRIDRTDNYRVSFVFCESLEASISSYRTRKGPGYHLRFNESARSLWIVWLQQRRHRHRPTKRLQVPEMKLNLSTGSAHLEPRAHELLNSIANVWPPAIRSNVRLFFSMMIHFAIEQINSEKLGNYRQRQQKS